MQVLNNCRILLIIAANVAERGDVLLVAVGPSGAVAKGQCVLLSVEGAEEFMAAAACHTGDRVLSRADVRVQLHGLADEAVVVGIILQHVAEHAPALGTVDGVLIGSRLLDVGRVGGEGCRHGDIAGWHGEAEDAIVIVDGDSIVVGILHEEVDFVTGRDCACHCHSLFCDRGDGVALCCDTVAADRNAVAQGDVSVLLDGVGIGCFTRCPCLEGIVIANEIRVRR